MFLLESLWNGLKSVRIFEMLQSGLKSVWIFEILFHKISIELVLNFPNLLLSDWIPVLRPLSFFDACHDNSVLQQRESKKYFLISVLINILFINDWQ